MKTLAIFTTIAAFLGKAWRFIKVGLKYKKIKTEIVEAYTEGMKAKEQAIETLSKIQSFFKEDSDGGKKLTIKELEEATKLIIQLTEQIKKTSVEGMEAYKEIKDAIDSIKGEVKNK